MSIKNLLNANTKYSLDAKVHDIAIAGDETISGNSIITGNLSVGGTLGVTNATTLSNTLNVTGLSTLANTDITGTLSLDDVQERTLNHGIDIASNLKLSTQPFFIMTLSGQQNLSTASTPTTLQFNTSTINIGTHFNTSTYTFTAPVTGVYLFNTNLNFSGLAGDMATFTLDLYVNTTQRKIWDGNISSIRNSANLYTHNCTYLLKLNSTDTVILRIESSGTLTNFRLEQTGSIFSGRLITTT
jgi:hypothetical protein